jgi:heat shock protein HslJ
LVSIDDLETGKSTLVESLVQASLRFSSDSTYSGSICNSFNGKYTYGQPETLTMNEPTASKKFCLSVSELEKRIFSLYVKVTRYKTDNSKLFIFTSSNYRLLYRKE